MATLFEVFENISAKNDTYVDEFMVQIRYEVKTIQNSILKWKTQVLSMLPDVLVKREACHDFLNFGVGIKLYLFNQALAVVSKLLMCISAIYLR